MATVSKTLESVNSPFNEITIEQTGRRIDMEVAGATFATWHPDHLLTGYSWDAITAGCLLAAKGPPLSILVLGLGGGTVTRQLRLLLPDTELTGVEIDPDVLRLSCRYMELDHQGLDVIEGDGYAFLKATERTFDVIVDDIYRTGPLDVWRPETVGGDLVNLLSSRLNPGGVLLANFITDGAHDRLRKAAQEVFATRFGATAVVRPPRGFNAILAGSDKLMPQRRLQAWAKSFPQRDDRALWRRIRVRSG